MFRVGSKALAVGLVGVAIGGASGPGCSAKKPTELVPGVFTQVQVPRDLAQIRIDVKANGVQKFCQAYDVTNGTVLLPATLGVVSGSSAQTVVTVEVRGYTQKAAATGTDLQSCAAATINDPTTGGPRILRRSIQSYVDQHTLFLPMPLSYSCFDQCASPDDSVTCKAGQCVDAHTDATTLVDFSPALVDGLQDCFPATQCFAAAVSAVPIDPANCVYGVPAFAQSSGLNVRVFYQDLEWGQNSATKMYQANVTNSSEQEILNEDPDEGFVTVVPNQQFRLATGLCNLAKAATTPPSPPTSGTGTYRTISSVLVATGCPAKTPLLPICANDRTTTSATADGGKTTDITCNVPVPLVPAPSAIYMAMDDSDEMSGAFGQSGYATAMGLSLAAPIFKRTFVAFQFLKHDVLDCTSATTSFATPDVSFGLALVNQPTIAKKLLTWVAPPASAPQDLYLEAALRPQGAYQYLSKFATGSTQLMDPLAVGAVMFFVNRTPLSFGGSGSDAGAGLDAGSGGLDGGVAATQSVDCPAPSSANADPILAAQASIQAAVNAAASGTPPLSTYFVVLDNAQHMSPLSFYSGITGATVLDATSTNAEQVLGNFAQTASTLGTCFYDLPPGVDSSATLAFGPGNTKIPFAAACNATAPDTVDGWNIDNGRIRVCGIGQMGASPPRSCTAIRDAVFAATANALQMDASSVPDIPVTATMPCVSSTVP